MSLSARDASLALVLVIVWAFNFIVIRTGLNELPPLLFGALRFLVAAVPVVFLLPRPKVGFRHLLAFGLALGVGKFAVLFFAMKQGMPTGLSSLTLQSQAFFTMALCALLFGERPSGKRIVGVAIAFAGLALVPRQLGSLDSLLPFLMVLFAAFFWAVSNVVLMKANPDDFLSFVSWVSLVPVLPLLGLSWIFEGPEVMGHALANLSLKGWGSVFYIGWLSTLFAFAIWGRLIKKYSASVVAPFSLLVPPIALVFCHHLLGEDLTGRQLFGAGLILLGLAFPFLKLGKRRGYAKAEGLSGGRVHAGEIRR